jgi:hypothetical protein
MTDNIEFKIIDIKEKDSGSFTVKIQFVSPDDNKLTTQIFSFIESDNINDLFLDKIKKKLDDQFNTNIKVVSDRFVGKTFYHKFGR